MTFHLNDQPDEEPSFDALHTKTYRQDKLAEELGSVTETMALPQPAYDTFDPKTVWNEVSLLPPRERQVLELIYFRDLNIPRSPKCCGRRWAP